jgi:hypothetical protein
MIGRQVRTTFFEKKVAKKLLRAGVGSSGVANRYRWWRFATPEVRTPARKSFFGYFFFKRSNFFLGSFS